jgi:hypothetical protein
VYNLEFEEGEQSLVVFLHHVVIVLAKVNSTVYNHLFFSAINRKNDVFILVVNRI